ncbi:MAG: hypothetical protein GY822_07900 [Deltaproteobacteria bacterium]|nr:hypothetical protein [Deltaproteobacteria bacterium]
MTKDESQKEKTPSLATGGKAPAIDQELLKTSIYDENPVSDDGPSPVQNKETKNRYSEVREFPISHHDNAQLLATFARGGVGVLFIVVSMLFLPIHMLTPIMSGMGVLMVVTGSYGAWRVGQNEPRLRSLTRVFVYGLPILGILGFTVSFILGPGAFAPDIRDLVDTRERDDPVFIPTPLNY